MMLHTPPECQGQMVEVSYGWQAGSLYRHVYDRSDRTAAWYVATTESAHETIDTGWEPWNTDCPISESGWTRCAEPLDSLED